MTSVFFPYTHARLTALVGTLYLLCVVFATSPAAAQGTFVTSAKLVGFGNVHIVLKDMNFTVSGQLIPGTSTFHFVGTAQTTVTNESALTSSFANVILDQPGGILLDNGTTSNGIGIAADFNFINGVVDGVTNDVVLAFGDAGTATGQSQASYVNGKVSKSGTQPFTFPIGSAIHYQALEIFDVGSATYVAQYFEQTHPNYPSPNPYYNGTSNIISTCDYWSFNKSSGSGNAKIRLTYGPDQCNYIEEPLKLFIARYNGLSWEQPIGEGSGPGTNASPSAGNTPSQAKITTYGDFALISSNADLNVLPIGLLDFTAAPVDDKFVKAEWITATETDNDFFTVERSRDGKDFASIGTLSGAGTSTTKLNYAYMDDAPYRGVSYYRLRQTDFDGASTVTPPVSVFLSEGDGFGIDAAYRCAHMLCLQYRSASPYLTAEIYDAVGRRVFADLIENYNGITDIPIDLARGIYFIRLGNGIESDVAKFLF